MGKYAATMADVRKYFSDGSLRPVTTAEFSEFWKSLSADDKEYFKNAVAAL